MKRLLAAVLLVAACGKRGDPRPPVPVIPRATSDLVVTQRGPHVILSWSYPSLTTAGANLRDIRRVTIYRCTESLPAPAAGRDAGTAPRDLDPSVAAPFALFAKVPTLTPGQFNKLKQTIDSIDGANLRGATVGSHLIYEDQPSIAAADGRPVRLTYAVVTDGRSARSELSNLVAIVPLEVPLPPSGVTATPKPEAVILSWTAPTRGIAGSSRPALAGYDIYRFGAGESLDELARPVNASAVTGTTYNDVPPYGNYSYVVTSVAHEGPPRLESVPSEIVSTTYRDLLPPPPPSGVTALVEETAVRLVWDAVEAPDLAGYKIYRTEGTARLMLTPYAIPQTNFRDISVQQGVHYFYSVTSIDKTGNESASSNTPLVLVPKVP
jgi:hypothetical protein